VDGSISDILDEDGNEMNDTFHETLEGALEQARFEFRVPPHEWPTFTTITRGIQERNAWIQNIAIDNYKDVPRSWPFRGL
jgi:hypothetical protein